MAITSLAPGVYSSIVDLGDFPNTIPSTIGFLPIICEQGPDNVLTRVTRNTFYSTYGEPNFDYLSTPSYAYGPYVASNFLEASDNLYIIRCLPEDAQFSHIRLRTGGFDITGSGVSDTTSDSGDTSGYGIGYEMSFYLDYYTDGAYNNYREMQIDVRNDSTTYVSDDTTNTNDPILMIFYGIGRGAYYNDIQIDISKHTNSILAEDGIYILDIYQKQKFSQRFSSVSDDTSVDYEIVESFEVSFDPKKVSSQGDKLFIEDRINTYSQKINCIADRSLLLEIQRRSELPDPSSSDTTSALDKVIANFDDAFSDYRWRYKLNQANTSTTYDSTTYFNIVSGASLTRGADLKYGSDGSIFTVNGSGVRVVNVGDVDTTNSLTWILSRAYRGLLKNPWIHIDEDGSYDADDEYLTEVLDTENYPFDVIFDAGYPFDVKTQIINLVNIRHDCVCFIDNGDHKTANRAITERKDAGGGTFAFNTKYAAIYEMYSKVYDIFTGGYLWLPPSYHLAQIVGLSDKNTEVWYPLAGFNRAVIQNIVATRYNPNQGDRDRFIDIQLNPIVQFPQGYAIFSQRTTQRRNTSLQDLNVVRLVVYIERALKNFCRNYIFELNDAQTWGEISTKINEFLSNIKDRRGLTNFEVKVGATALDIKMRRVNVNITLDPIRAIEQIQLNFFIL